MSVAMRRAKADKHECDVLAQEHSCLEDLIGRMPGQALKRDVSVPEHDEVNHKEDN